MRRGIADEQPTRLGKAAAVSLIALSVVAAVCNIATHDVPTPGAFPVTVVGFGLFAAAKMSVIARGRLVSFGTGPMSPAFANAYRLGYWLMLVGIILTFAD